VQSAEDVVKLILERFRSRRVSQVPGYNSFGYVGETERAVIVSRENGKDTRVPIARLEIGVSAVRHDPGVYDGGPRRLRDYEIRYVTSPVWSLLHLVTKGAILGL